jgi:hypothetical protein
VSEETYRVTWSAPKWIQDRCMGKISHDGGITWWPRGPLEVHVAGETYVLLLSGRYERKQ